MKSQPINVTKSFLPPIDEFVNQISEIWETGQLTNSGPLSKEFEAAISGFLELDKYTGFRFVSNGTLAIQLALNALDITNGDIITTPFSYVATTSALLWERCNPKFVDIDRETLNIDVKKIEGAITDTTRAILAVHVFGNPCDIEAIDAIAKKHNLKVIYDAAHAFAVKYNGKSIFEYGDISTCSFHATKLFHTIEGGGVFSSDKAVIEKVELVKRFGHHGDDHKMLGINAKANEFQAAMGLVNLRYTSKNIEARKKISEIYDHRLRSELQRQTIVSGTLYNFAYYPIIFESEKETMSVVNRLAKDNIFPRRYFYPSLNTIDYVQSEDRCPVSEDISKRILCVPLYPDLQLEDVERICKGVNNG